MEEDIGLLWFMPELLSYRGDTRYFDIRCDQLMQIEGKADAGSTSAYFGAVNVILHYVEDGGAQRQVRLHVENVWTMTGAARAPMDAGPEGSGMEGFISSSTDIAVPAL